MTKYFTPDEANAMLPLLQEELSRLQGMTKEYEERYMDLQDRKAEYDASGGTEKDPFFTEEGALDFMRIEIMAMAKGFALKGVQIKMIEPGLLDFPARMGGGEVLLCWKQGEPRVSHYHGLQDGFMGRKPLP